MKPKVIKNDKDYRQTLQRIETLFDAKSGSIEEQELDVLVLLVEKYEAEKFPISLPDPISALKFRMDQECLRQNDLVPYLGSKSKVSEVLSGRRELSLTMIRKLVAGLGIPPEVLLQIPQETQKQLSHNNLV